MNSLFEVLNKIEKAYGDPKRAREQQREGEENLDEFTKLKRKIARDLKDIRKEIKERNDLLGETGNNTTSVKMGAQIRTKLAGVVADQQALDGIVKKEQMKIEKKKSKGKEVPEEGIKKMEKQADIVENCRKHIEECKLQEKSGYIRDNTLLFMDNGKGKEPTITELPNIDDDGFQTLLRNNDVIDRKLELVSQGVTVLGQMAHEISNQIDVQTQLTGELNTQVDRAQATLDSLNQRLKDQLKSVRKADKFILDVILIVVLLGIIGYIYNVVTNKN